MPDCTQLLTCGLKMLRMVVPFITQYNRMTMETTATTMMAPSCAPLIESAVGLQLFSGLDSSAYLDMVGKYNDNDGKCMLVRV